MTLKYLTTISSSVYDRIILNFLVHDNLQHNVGRFNHNETSTGPCD